VAVTFRSKTSTQRTATGNETVTEPAGATSGDALIALVVADAATTIGIPAGWHSLYTGTTGSADFSVSWIERGGSAPSLTWTFTGTNIYREVQILCLQGSAAITLDSQSASGGTGTSDHNPDPPSTTAVASTSLAVAGAVNFASFFSYTASTGYTIRTDTTSNLYDGVMETKSLSASGAENPSAIADGNNGDWWEGCTVTFTDVSASGQVPYQPQYLNAPVMAQ